MYKVLADFADMHDIGHLYRAGDAFPRDGAEVDAVRIRELSSNINRRGLPLIEWVSDSANVKESGVKTAENAPESKLEAPADAEKPKKRRRPRPMAEGD